jgi:V8-like Glu-specific endopeptidase
LIFIKFIYLFTLQSNIISPPSILSNKSFPDSTFPSLPAPLCVSMPPPPPPTTTQPSPSPYPKHQITAELDSSFPIEARKSCPFRGIGFRVRQATVSRTTPAHVVGGHSWNQAGHLIYNVQGSYTQLTVYLVIQSIRALNSPG